jgi:hypothetical protein
VIDASSYDQISDFQVSTHRIAGGGENALWASDVTASWAKLAGVTREELSEGEDSRLTDSRRREVLFTRPVHTCSLLHDLSLAPPNCVS